VTLERRQIRLLTRTFFTRLFENDLLPAGMPQVQIVVSVFAFLAGPSLILPLWLMKKYVWMGDPAVVQASMAADRTLALLLTMTATALITLVIWETLFPDRRDSRIFGVLPVSRRAMVTGRLAAIALLFVIVCLGPAAIASFGFAILGAMTNQGFAGVYAAHFAATAAAQGMVFFGIVLVQCGLLILAGARMAQRLAVVLQIGLIVAVLQMPLLLPGAGRYALDASGSPIWLATGSVWLPPLWFLSLYQWLIGAPYAGSGPLIALAATLGVALPLVALGAYAASFRRLTRLAIEGRPLPRLRPPWRSWRVLDRVSAMLARSSEGAAVCAFTLRTLARNRQHRLVLAVWVGVALALTISAMLPLIVRFGWARLAEPSQAALVGPLIFAALIQAGMRTLFAIPVEIGARWVLRVHEPIHAAAAVEGATAALVVGGVAAPALLALLMGWLLWGIAIGLAHAVFVGALALVLAQVFSYGLDRVPFTVAYAPGTARINTLWPFYLMAFSTFTYAMAALEAHVLRSGTSFLRTVAGFVALGLALAFVRRRAARRLPGIRFEPNTDGLVVVSLQADRTPGAS
jgi:hypothetical protein